jgi:aldehyde dehydrogenase (NAD+)
MNDTMIIQLLTRLGVTPTRGCSDGRVASVGSGSVVTSINPSTGRVLAEVTLAGLDDYQRLAENSVAGFDQWRRLPPPARGELVREFGEALRKNKQDLGLLVTLEAGKILSEGLGEVQEMIDMCDFAVGLSRQLHGLTIASERVDHRLYEQWHPLGPVGVITAFNFPVAVWAWNSAVALVCGDPVLWKPSPLTPLTALAVQHLVHQTFGARGFSGVVSLACGDTAIGQAIAADARFPLVSATGSCEMGRSVAQVVASRLGRSLLELGGNNALILTPSANRELALRAVLFASVGTGGNVARRCDD